MHLIAAWGLVFLCVVVLYLRSPGKSFNLSHNSFSGISYDKIPQDFSVYLRATERVKRNTNPYVVGEVLPYKYAPGFLVPLSFLPKDQASAWKVFGGLSLLAWASAILFGVSFKNWKQVGSLFLGLVLSWKGILETLDYGQIEFFLFFFLTISALLWRNYPSFTGILMGSLPWIKLPWLFFWLPFGLILWVQPSKKSFFRFFSGYFFASSVWLLFLPCFWFGGEETYQLTLSWIRMICARTEDVYFSDFNQGITVTMQQWLHLPLWLALVLTLTFGTAFSFLLLRRSMKSEAQECCLGWISPWILLGHLLNPLAWRWGSLLLIGIPFSLERHTLIQKPSYRRLLYWLAFSLWLAQQNPITQVFHYHWTDFHSIKNISAYWIVWLLLVV